MKERNVKQVMLRGRVTGMGSVSKEGKEGYIWSMYFLYLHEDGTLKPVEVILRRGEGYEGE
jgi:hypothetical protein